MKQERNKVYVLVNADHNPDGTCRPRFITLEDGRKFEIDRLIHRCRAAATKVGGTGIYKSWRYGYPLYGIYLRKANLPF